MIVFTIHCTLISIYKNRALASDTRMLAMIITHILEILTDQLIDYDWVMIIPLR